MSKYDNCSSRNAGKRKTTSKKQEVRLKEPPGKLVASKEPTVSISGMDHYYIRRF